MADSTNTRIETADVLAIDAAVMRSSGSSQFGVTREGFIPKPYARLLAEKLALARELFGADLDLGSGSAIRKLLEVSALEDARTWAALTSMYDNNFISTATGEALSRLGEEVGITRPFLEAAGKVRLNLVGSLPEGMEQLSIPRGARMLTAGGHHVAVDEAVVLSGANPEREASVVAFYPGPEHNLDPAVPGLDRNFPQKISSWNKADTALGHLFAAEEKAHTELIKINHTSRLSGGELQWPDSRYRQLLLQAPRSLWTVGAIQIAVSLIPGVRQVQVRDSFGGLDLSQSIFGTFNFMERLFSADRSLVSPYYFTVLVAPIQAAIWEGRDGLKASIESAIEDLRPISIFPKIIQAVQIGVSVRAGLMVKGIPMPTGPRNVVNNSSPAKALKQRLLARLQGYIDTLSFGEPVRASEIIWAMMSEPGVVDILDLELLRYPSAIEVVDFNSSGSPNGRQVFGQGKNVTLQSGEVPVFIDDSTGLVIL